MRRGMKNSKAIVTLTLGDRYIHAWRHGCEENWNAYATKHGYDLIRLEQPLDRSERATNRSASWQKCLVLSQDFAKDYDRIVWIDSDVVINHQTAPSIVDGVPEDKVGAVELFSYANHAGSYGRAALLRMYDFWKTAVVNTEAKDYYTEYGFPNGFDAVVQAGVLVLSPARHQALLEKVYYDYEDRGGAKWHYEMRPLSYELMKSGVVYWLDPRFNVLWLDCLFLQYPFLINGVPQRSLLSRVWRKLGRAAGFLTVDEVWNAAQRTTFLNSYFLHFGGPDLDDMETLDKTNASWLDSAL